MYTILRKQLRLEFLEKVLKDLIKNKDIYLKKAEQNAKSLYNNVPIEELRENIEQEFANEVQYLESKISELRIAVK